MKERQEREFVAHLDRHKGMLVQIAAAYARPAADREDLVQTIACELWRAFGTYDPQRTFSTWMYRIALNVAISYARKQRRYGASVITSERLPEAAAAAGEDAQLDALYELIASLSEFDRALVLLYLQEQTHAQIAEILGISQTNVATRIGRIKDRLRKSAAPAPAAGR